MAGSAVQSTLEDTGPLVNRNIELIKLITRLWATNQKFQAVMPSEAHIVIIPLDDPELARFNLEISKKVEDPLYIHVKGVRGAHREVEVVPLVPGRKVQSFNCTWSAEA